MVRWAVAREAAEYGSRARGVKGRPMRAEHSLRMLPGMVRLVTHRYEDPLEVIWCAAARDLGLRVERSDEVFASTDGRGTLTLGTPATLDADDCVAQMVFHELCHALVQGPESFATPDWGLDNESARDLDREYACLRVQAVLAQRYGLRSLLAPTTDHRAFYDRLGCDPLADDDPSVAFARRALDWAAQPSWVPLHRALEATARIAALVTDVGPNADSLWSRFSMDAQGRP